MKNLTSKNKTIIYIRIASESTINQVIELDRQRELCLAHAKTNNMDVLKIFEEVDLTKEAITDLLNYLQNEKNEMPDYLLVEKSDKLNLDFHYAVYLLTELENRGISIISVSEFNGLTKPDLLKQILELALKKN